MAYPADAVADATSAAKVRMAISASLCWIMPNCEMVVPKALRSCAYFKQICSTYSCSRRRKPGQA